MRAGRGFRSAVLALCSALILSGCASGPLSTDAPSGLDLPSVGPSTALAARNVNGVTVSLPVAWRAQPVQGALQLADPGGGATITVVVSEALKEDAAPNEPAYTASSYLEVALPHLVKDTTGVDIQESLTGQTRPVDVPGAADAARLEVTGVRAAEPVDCSVVAAQVSPNIALVIGTDVEAGLWEQIVASLRVGALEPS